MVARAVDEALTRDLAEDSLRYYQLVQSGERRYRLLLVPDEGYGAEVEADLLARLRGLLGAECEFSVETCRSLPPATNGKYRLCYADL